MSEATKAVNLTEKEIKMLITNQGHNLYGDVDDINEGMERLKYFHQRLKSFSNGSEAAPVEAKNELNATPAPAGWGANA